ncbi:MAG: hypothetical protein D9V47_12920 [Clostridia bacterium]|nr:MAG: hypothetical protein D9V47_12920 [Clostridia bacterium]
MNKRNVLLLAAAVLGIVSLLASRTAMAQVEAILPVHEFPILGRNFAIGAFAVGHVIFPAISLGGPIVALISEILGTVRRDLRYDRFAKTVLKFTAIVFSVGATFGVVIVVLFAALTPGFWMLGVNIFTWPLVLEGIMFFLEAATLYAYWYMWDRMADRRGLHLSLGVGNIIFGTITMLIINGVGAIMLTPPEGLVPVLQDLASGGIKQLPEISLGLAASLLYLGNPTWMILNLHRFVANISFVGFLFAAVMAFYALRDRQSESRSFYNWATGYSLLWGVIPVFFMPLIGFEYVSAIRDYQQSFGQAIPQLYQALTGNGAGTMYAPFTNIMITKNWTFTALVAFLSLMVIATSAYFVRRANGGTVGYGSLMLQLVGGLLLVVNIGGMTEDYIGLVFLVTGALIAVVNYVQKSKGIDFSVDIPAWGYYAAMVTSIIVTYTIGVMGFVREMARFPYLVPGVMRIADMAPHSTAPTGMETTAGHVLLVVTVAVILDAIFILIGLKLTHVPAVEAAPAMEPVRARVTQAAGV